MKRLFSLLTLVALLFALAGCVPPYRAIFEDAGKAKHWTKKQTLAAFAYADRLWWARQVGGEDSTQFVIIYGKVPTAKVASQIETVLKDLDQSLDPNNAEMVQYLDTFKLRADLEHEEKITEAQYARVHAADLENQFKQKMGDLPEYGPEAEMSKGYSLRRIFVAKDIAEAFPFKSSQIEGAKADGSLKEIESLELEYASPYDHKAADPKHPDDENEFIWKAAKRSIRLTNYKIVTEDKPQDNKGNYIEGYRVIDGKQESKPALKIFFPAGGEGAIVLIDTDREGETGFGVPDILESAYDLDNVQEVISNGTLLSALFQEKKSEKRVLPPHNLFKIEISKVDQPIDQWEKSPSAEGWIVPFKYVDMMGDNYNVRIKFKKPKIDPSNSGYPADHEHSMYMEIEYIAKEYTKAGERYEASPGQVIEYYHPKSQFAGKVQAKVLYNENTKKVSFEFENGDEINGIVTATENKFAVGKPYAISYTEGGKRWWIEASGDAGKFDKRKQVSPPKERTGEYNDYDMEDTMRAASAKSGPNDDEDLKAKSPKQ